MAETPILRADEIALPTKPLLRGWLHVATAPVAAVAGLVLVLAAPTDRVRLGMAVFAATAVLLFGVSALYHRLRWSPRMHRLLKRLDHANIFLIIAGTTTAFALSLLPPSRARLLLTLVWAGAAVGVALKVAWPNVPRWVGVPCYVLLGWTAVWFGADLARGGGPLVLALIVLGGVLYTAGAVVYGTKRPDPLPLRFGFHEVFHLLTVLAFAAHLGAAGIVVARAGQVALGTA